MRSGAERILVVDDEAVICRLLQAVLGEAGYRVTALQDSEDAIKALGRESFDLVISDVRMPRANGVDILKAVKMRSRNTAVILMTAFGTTKTAVEAMRLGTSDYISKPFRNEDIRFIVEGVLERRRLASENQRLRQELAAADGFGGMVGVGTAMRQTFRLLADAAECDETLLIDGDVGTGRETAARAVHLNGRRAAAAFVIVDAASLTPDEAEERIFGRSAGVFTDAFSGRPGLLASAEGGTLLLKAPEAFPQTIQTKLLRFLQDRRFRRPGSIEWSPLDVRAIIATGAGPNGLGNDEAVRFRRLAAMRAALPPLRERREDIAPLAAHFLTRAARRDARGNIAFTADAVEVLRTHDWPGNARELMDVVEQSLAAAAHGRVETCDLPASVGAERDLAGRTETDSFRNAKQAVVESFERSYLVRLLKISDGNMTRAAAAAEMDRKNLYELLKKHGLDSR